MEIENIIGTLPHRYPFLMVDRVVELNVGENNKILVQKNLTINEMFFQGHFPTAPIMPGVLMIEILAQAAGILAYTKGYSDYEAQLIALSNVKIREPAFPGDVLHGIIEDPFMSKRGMRVDDGVIKRDGRVLMQASFTLKFFKKKS